MCVCVCVGTEITFDYMFERFGAAKQRCHCGAPSCRGYLGAKRSNDLGGTSNDHLLDTDAVCTCFTTPSRISISISIPISICITIAIAIAIAITISVAVVHYRMKISMSLWKGCHTMLQRRCSRCMKRYTIRNRRLGCSILLNKFPTSNHYIDIPCVISITVTIAITITITIIIITLTLRRRNYMNDSTPYHQHHGHCYTYPSPSHILCSALSVCRSENPVMSMRDLKKSFMNFSSRHSLV